MIEQVQTLVKETEELREIILELSICNKGLGNSLKKEIRKNEKLQLSLTQAEKELTYYKQDTNSYLSKVYSLQEKIKTIEDALKISHAEKNALLRKLNINEGYRL